MDWRFFRLDEASDSVPGQPLRLDRLQNWRGTFSLFFTIFFITTPDNGSGEMFCFIFSLTN